MPLHDPNCPAPTRPRPGSLGRTALATLLLAGLAACVVVPAGGPRGLARFPLPVAAPVQSPAPRPAPSPSAGDPIVIRDNRGGNVMSAMIRRAEMEASGRPVEIRGYCGSACTIFITMSNACLDPNGTVGFHAANFSRTRIISPAGGVVASYYRGGVRQKYLAEWGQTTTVTRISAREYVKLDPQTRLCRS